jgi:hypothetical protein
MLHGVRAMSRKRGIMRCVHGVGAASRSRYCGDASTAAESSQ